VKRAFLDEADPQEVAHAVRLVVERRGGLVREHVTSRVRFTDQPKGKAWLRDGYVGIYQPLGEPQVELRLALHARWPRRLVWLVALADLVMAILFFVLSPEGNAWIVGAALGFFALLAAGLVYLNTLEPVREEEKVWIAAFDAELRQELPETSLEDDVAHELRQHELELEGEIAQRRVTKARKNEPKPVKQPKPPKEKGKRFALLPKKKDAEAAPPEETPEERLAKLRARKAEIEAQQQRENEP
jgi:hypothetical protein